MSKILAIADTHGGSRWGLATPDWISERMKGRSECLAMNSEFVKIRDKVGKVDYLLCGGDLADGTNVKEQGKDLMMDAPHQVLMIAELLKTIKGSPKIYCVEGTPYHTGVQSLDEEVAKGVGAIPDAYGRFAPKFWLLDIDGVRFSLAHKITVSSSSWQFRSTPLALRLVLSRLNRQEDPDKYFILLRAHCHTFQGVFYKHQLGMTIPAFEARTPFAEERMPENNPDIGALLFETNNGKLEHWEPFVNSFEHRAVQA